MKKLLLISSLLLIAVIGKSQDFGVSPLRMPKSMFDFNKGPESLCDTAINFDDANVSGVGIQNGNLTWRAGIFVDSIEMKFYVAEAKVEAVQFYIRDDGAWDSIVLKIHEGAAITDYTYNANLLAGPVIYSKNINADISLDNFGTHVLDSVLTLDKSLGYFVELEIYQTTGGFPMGADGEPQVEAKGGWISTGATYGQMVNSGIDRNWNIRLCTQGDIFIPPLDAALTDVSFTPTGYEMTPLTQLNATGYDFWVEVENKGADALTNLAVSLDVNSGSFSDAGIIGSISSFATSNLQLNQKYQPNSEGFHTVDASVAITQTKVEYDSTNIIDTTVTLVLDTSWIDTVLTDTFIVGSNTYDADIYMLNDTVYILDTVVIVSSDTLVGPDTIAILSYEVYTSVQTYDTTLNIDTINWSDFNFTDNFKSGQFYISDTIYSRTLGNNIYSTFPGYYGNVYEINSEAYVQTVRTQCFNPPSGLLVTGDTMWAKVYEFVGGSVIGPLYTAEPLIVSDTIDNFEYYIFDFDFTKTNALLLEGNYFVAVSAYGTLLFNSDINHYVDQTAYAGDENGENWVESSERYYNVDLILSETQLFDGLKETLNSINVSPNPANNIVEITGLDCNSNIEIIDITGKMIMQKNNKFEKAMVLDISELKKGLYIIKVINNGISSSQKLIVD